MLPGPTFEKKLRGSRASERGKTFFLRAVWGGRTKGQQCGDGPLDGKQSDEKKGIKIWRKASGLSYLAVKRGLYAVRGADIEKRGDRAGIETMGEEGRDSLQWKSVTGTQEISSETFREKRGPNWNLERGLTDQGTPRQKEGVIRRKALSDVFRRGGGRRRGGRGCRKT